MKAIRLATAVVISLLVFMPALAQSEDDVTTHLETGYELMWATIDGGGSTSIAGGYVLSATIGQPDAGAATGGEYVLTGGFWSGGAAAGDDLFLPLIRR